MRFLELIGLGFGSGGQDFEGKAESDGADAESSVMLRGTRGGPKQPMFNTSPEELMGAG